VNSFEDSKGEIRFILRYTFVAEILLKMAQRHEKIEKKESVQVESVLDKTYSKYKSDLSFNPEYPERTIDHGQATGKPYHLRCESSVPFL
jgi:hypothetical protein